MPSSNNLATWRMPDRLSASFRQHADIGIRQHFSRGQMLYLQGEIKEHFYFIDQGFVRISILHESGQEALLDVMGPGTICGEGAAFDKMPNFSSAQAMSPVEAIAFRTQDIVETLAKDPDFGIDLLSAIAEKQRVVAVKVGVASLDSEQRILEFLSRQATLFGEDSSEGCIIKTNLTHEKIAALTGASRVTITRTLIKMRRDGVIDKLDGYYVLPKQ